MRKTLWQSIIWEQAVSEAVNQSNLSDHNKIRPEPDLESFKNSSKIMGLFGIFLLILALVINLYLYWHFSVLTDFQNLDISKVATYSTASFFGMVAPSVIWSGIVVDTKDKIIAGLLLISSSFAHASPFMLFLPIGIMLYGWRRFRSGNENVYMVLFTHFIWWIILIIGFVLFYESIFCYLFVD
jgi:hypothetical protein